MAVFFLIGLIAFGAITSNDIPRENGILGGPDIAKAQNVSIEPNPAATLTSPSEVTTHGYSGLNLSSDIDEYGPLSATLNGASLPVNYSQVGGLITYVVKKGDTLSHISARFDVSIQTILSANPGLKASGLQVGQEIRILPTTGVIYMVVEGDTPESIADSFGIELAHIMQYNTSANFTSLQPGESIIIPGTNLNSNSYGKNSSLPNLGDYFSNPTLGFNWGKLHQANAVDIANSCGTEVFASAEGLVVPDQNYDNNKEGWNGGYGSFVFIEHPNNTATRYAHLEEVLIEIGDYVKKGDLIGTMGATGNVHGPTGCHLHFEVIGAQNPLVRY